jgi:hypothetical protein
MRSGLNIQHREREAELGNAQTPSPTGSERGVLAARPVTGRAAVRPPPGRALGNAADVVRMMVRGEDGGELQALAREVLEHRPRFARIHHRGVARVAKGPDVVVLQRG